MTCCTSSPRKLSAKSVAAGFSGQAGFSLVEMAIVMVILGLMLGSLIIPLSTQRDVNNQKETERLLGEIHDALLGFAVANGRLPCPATQASNGLAAPDVAVANCTQAHGFVPARTLGLNGAFDNNNLLVDAWNRPLRYSLSPGYSNTIAIGTNGSYRICRQSACATADILAEGVVAVVASRGKDGALAPASADQLENIDGDNDFVTRALSEATNNEFDDVLRWISPNTLVYGMLRAGQLE